MPARSSTPSSICSASRRARSSRISAATRARRAIRRAPRTSTTSISRPARSASASRRRCSRRSSQDYVRAHGWGKDRPEGRMVALVGDAELDEGNIFEALLEGWKQGLRNCWWIIDYNRQSLDAVVREGLWARYETAVQELRLGRRDPEIRLAAARPRSRSRAARRCAHGSTPARTSSTRRWSSRAARPGASACSTTSATRATSRELIEKRTRRRTGAR